MASMALKPNSPRSFIATVRYWSQGIRLYIALTTVLITAFIILWSHSLYGGTTLYPTRIEEVTAWLALIYLVIAISIGPIYSLFVNLAGKKLAFDARRLIGISAAWFATVHALVTYSVLFKAVNPLHIPGTYQKAFLAGTVALLILLAMAFTSFDKAFKDMGIWWFRLHRLVYAAVALTVLHAFMIGAHAVNTVVLIVIATVAVLFLLVYLRLLIRDGFSRRWQLIGVGAMAVAVGLILLFGFMKHASVNSVMALPAVKQGKSYE